MEEPRANTAIKCPTDLLAVQTLPSTSAHGDEGVNSRQPLMVDIRIQFSLVQSQTVNKSDGTGQWKPILLGTAEIH